MTTPHARRAAAHALHDTFAKARGEQWLRFRGDSMAPTLREGDLLSVRRVADDDLVFGDIVVFDVAGVRVVHRLLRPPRRHMPPLTKGDNAWRVDAPFPSERLVGKVCMVRRGAGRIDLERRRWRAMSCVIASASLLEARLLWSAVALRRRWFPSGVVRWGLERRALHLLIRCRRLAIGALLQGVRHGDS